MELVLQNSSKKLDENLEIVVNLQLFANPEDEGRTEEPTERKLREAREKGKVAKTPELSAALTMLVSFVILAFLSRHILSDLLLYFRRIFMDIENPDIFTSARGEIGLKLVYQMFKILTPILLGSMLFAFFADMLQVGFKVTLYPLQPDFSKISFTFEKMMNRIFFSRQVLVNLIKSILKVSVIIIVSFLVIKADYNKIISTMHMNIYGALSVVSWDTLKIIIWVSIILIIFSSFDYLYQRWEHYQSLKMSIQELKEERKQYEGDPYIKARQRERHRELAMKRMMQEVPKANVVVTNPTHYAVALLYDSSYMNAPQVIAKGVDLIAKRIKEIAMENGIPLFEDRPLARALYETVDIGEEIPEQLFEAVVRVYAFVNKMKEEVS